MYGHPHPAMAASGCSRLVAAGLKAEETARWFYLRSYVRKMDRLVRNRT
jgi:hypothetical protein